MEIGEDGQRQSKEKFLRTFSDFMTKIAEYEELMTIGSILLGEFRQALGFIGRPPIDKTSTLVKGIIKAHGTKRLLSYVEAGSLNSHDTIQNASKLHTCHPGLQEHICKAKSILNELKCLVDNDALMLQSIMEEDEDVNPIIGNEEVSWSDPSKPKTVDYVALMAIIYGMVKQDYTMQDRIVSSLTLKSSPGELETYCQMWSLRPFIDDDIMQKAWSLIP
ncbi:hypothetical protein ACJIZ3_000016 [Penstemon smallii]|uniref:DUF7795 domain-containing protein n=1 Tax=Penstemon smallii TaxID=265156 RepID=A0ABD3RBU8_9LAMI